jgi:hypothetical protein
MTVQITLMMISIRLGRKAPQTSPIMPPTIKAVNVGAIIAPIPMPDSIPEIRYTGHLIFPNLSVSPQKTTAKRPMIIPASCPCFQVILPSARKKTPRYPD